MRRTGALLLAVCSSACGDTVVAPTAAANAGGNGSYDIVLNASPRSYMVVIGAAELNGRLPMGAQITAIAWRNASWIAHTSWPSAAAEFSQFDVYLATAARAPGLLSLADPMSNAGSDLTMVHSGPLEVPAGAFPGGAISPGRNPFGMPIPLTGGYTYQGGHLLVMVRHTGCGASSGSLDWVQSQFAGSGGQAIYAPSYTQNSNWSPAGNAGALAVQFTFEMPLSGPCYPNCDDSTTAPVLNVADFACFLERFAGGEAYANCDLSTTEPALNVADFACFLQKFAAGCR